MSTRKLYEAGYRDLLPVVPPKADLAPTTTLKPEARGKVPGKRRIDGRWVGFNWTDSEPATRKDLEEWERWGANTGLRGDHFPGLDIDVEHPQLAQFVVQEAHAVLGAAPVRTSRDPRRCLVYRTDEPFTRISCDITYKGKTHTVEVLGEGRQYLVHGGHPSGNRYAWEGKPLWEWAPDDLYAISAPEVIKFFNHLRTKLEGRAEVTIQGTGESKDKTAPPQETLVAPDQEALAELVARVPNIFPDRDTYIQVGHAIKAAGGEEAFDIFLEWALRWEGGANEPETVEADWSRMHPPFRVGWEYLQDLAADLSDYVPAQDTFEADPDVQPVDVDTAENNASGVIEFTDTWVVEQVAARLSDRVRYVPETGHWHVWGP